MTVARFGSGQCPRWLIVPIDWYVSRIRAVRSGSSRLRLRSEAIEAPCPDYRIVKVICRNFRVEAKNPSSAALSVKHTSVGQPEKLSAATAVVPSPPGRGLG